MQEKQGNHKRKYVLERLKKYIKRSNREVVVFILVKLLTIPLVLISPYFIKLLIDRVMYNARTEVFTTIICGMLAIYAVRFILELIALKCSNKIYNRTSYLLRSDIWKKYLKLDYAEYEKKNPGDLKMGLSDDVESLGNFVNEQVVVYLYSILMAVCAFVLSLYTNVALTLICACVFPVIFFVNHLIGKGTGKVNGQKRDVYKEYNTFEHDSLQAWQEIKVHNLEEDFISRFKDYRGILARLGYKWIRYWYFSEVFADIKQNYLTRILVFMASAFFILNGEVTMGTAVMLSEYFGILLTSLDAVNMKRTELKINSVYYDKIFEILNFKEGYGGEILQIDGKNASVTFENVFFKYREDTDYVIKDKNMKIDRGEHVYLKGENGCGKTTLIKLLLNLYSPDGGSVKINGVDVRGINKRCLYGQIGVVMQDPYFFNESIWENLMAVNRCATREDLERACVKANIHEFITSLPEGYDTVIGEKGLKLSGGQRQRLAIARLFLREYKVIILDEATSSLDKVSEDLVLAGMLEDVTVIAVMHRQRG